MLKNHLTIAWRNLTRRKAGSFIHIFGLTIGLSLCIVIYLITSFELSFDRFHPNKENIYRLTGKMKFKEGERIPVGFLPYAVAKALREEISGLKSVAAFVNTETAVLIPDGEKAPRKFDSREHGVDPAQIVFAEPQYFDIFKYNWVAGNPKTAITEPFSVVLTRDKAERYFGNISNSEMLGKEIIYHDSIRTRLTGIVEAFKGNTDLTFTDFISYSSIPVSYAKNFININEWNDNWSASQAFVVLPEGSKPKDLSQKFKAFNEKHFTGDFNFLPELQPLSDLHFNAELRDNYSRQAHKPTLYGLLGIAIFILIIAVINFINLATAQSFQRAKEVGVRKVLGSNRAALVMQFMTETFIITIISIGLAIALVPYLLELFKDYIPAGVAFRFSPQNGIFLISVLGITTLLAGVYPALVLSGMLPVNTLKGKNAQVAGSNYLRRGLIVFQCAVSLVFIVGTFFVGQQLYYMRNKDLGFQSEAVLTIHAPRIRDVKTPVLFEKIISIPGVEDATRQIFEPMGQNFGVDNLIYKGKEVKNIGAAYKMGADNFISFYKMKIIAGRDLEKSDTARELVVSESFLEKMGLSTPDSAINQMVQWHGRPYPIVGVIKDFHQLSMHEKMPATFITVAKNPRDIAVRLRDKNLKKSKETIAQIEAAWKSVYPDQPFKYTFLDESIASFFQQEQKTSMLISAAAIISILISCLGLYGLSVFIVQRRYKEIGIRKVSGATSGNIARLISGEFVWLMLIAALIAFPVAGYFVYQWLMDFQYRIDMQWWVYVLALLAGVAVVFVAAGLEAMRAARANPARALRTE
ncbi:ABC transporter permease [Pollutibacter soli]|uniref:ABC transporter permease n=1 Tax=Pollutibacter soli TaxID=3034157 RepID=UPI00301372B0